MKGEVVRSDARESHIRSFALHRLAAAVETIVVVAIALNIAIMFFNASLRNVFKKV